MRRWILYVKMSVICRQWRHRCAGRLLGGPATTATFQRDVQLTARLKNNPTGTGRCNYTHSTHVASIERPSDVPTPIGLYRVLNWFRRIGAGERKIIHVRKELEWQNISKYKLAPILAGFTLKGDNTPLFGIIYPSRPFDDAFRTSSAVAGKSPSSPRRPRAPTRPSRDRPVVVDRWFPPWWSLGLSRSGNSRTQNGRSSFQVSILKTAVDMWRENWNTKYLCEY